jgi:hypothetical protein
MDIPDFHNPVSEDSERKTMDFRFKTMARIHHRASSLSAYLSRAPPDDELAEKARDMAVSPHGIKAQETVAICAKRTIGAVQADAPLACVTLSCIFSARGKVCDDTEMSQKKARSLHFRSSMRPPNC